VLTAGGGVANWIGYSFVTMTLALNRNGAATFSVGEAPFVRLPFAVRSPWVPISLVLH
jgi:hypothetical protein